MDLSKPVTSGYILAAIAVISVFIAIGLAIVRYYKKRDEER